MTTPLRVLSVEDNPDDVVLLERELRRGGFEVHCERVQTAEELHEALRRGPWDVILSDYCMPGFDAPSALRVLRDSGLDIPFIVVSGSVGEWEGVEVMKAGARDYFPKSLLTRLPAAVSRELAEARIRHERARAERDRALLSRASEVLARSLDFQETLEQVVRLAVPELSSWCALYYSDDGKTLRMAALEHEDPAQVARGFEMARRFPVDPGAATGPAWVWRGGEPQLLTDVPSSRLEVLAQSPEHLRYLLDLRLRSVIHVPLRGRTVNLGVMTLGASEDRPRFSQSDLSVALELARRSALALENARLYLESQEAIRLRDEFLAVAAHELRTPLTTLGLQLGTLVQRARRESSGDMVERLERGLRQVRRLGTLVETLLDVSLLSTGELPLALERVDLGELAGEVLERFEAEARAVGCALTLDVPRGLVGQWDRLRVEQVVSGLLANALKFGPRQPVEVRGSSDGKVARLVVEDRGIGIPEDQLERIFERFGRAVSSRSYGGLGLGLYLARRAAEAHGGRVWAASRPGGGACFTLELPLEPA
ncbi:hybrid sensor histidine kinase/response regulator [Archangium violaceum]|uniref:hybrid sensor histidine kinase/response regulator n=1 Tax=Archangium violaceum TaxID=83451 RepID=UPI00193B5C2E|nr:hybrid sensor histidine kinase/response regulator [Archangium violaceum]QRK11657.1 hybrid sensor histidine kinase/response regulator [Archangium violaceum]